MLWLCDIRLPAQGSGVGKARSLIDALGLALPSESRDDLRLLVSEVVTNAVRHGSPDGRAARPLVRIRVGREDARIRVEVHDFGPGFQPIPRGPRSRLDSGWGVHFVDQLADRWGAEHHDGGSLVWFELYLPHRPGTSDAMVPGQCADDLARAARAR